MNSYDSRYLQYFELFNGGDFFEAHEVLEMLWMETAGPKREFYQGLIQIAAIFVHLKNHNIAGCEKLYQTASGHLAGYPEPYMGISISSILEYVRGCVDRKLIHPKLPLPNEVVVSPPE